MRALKTILFHILYPLRGVVKLLLRLFTGLFLLGFLMLLIVGGHAGMGIGTKIFVFALFVGCAALSWYYDMLLLKLAPEHVNLTLFN